MKLFKHGAIIFLIGTNVCNSVAQNLNINEICASNYKCYVDAEGDHGDWIEIYNAGGTNFDVAGMYLTDDLSVPDKYLILSGSASTIISAGGRGIFWFDEDEYKGVTHIDGKLNGGGEQVGLVASDGVTFIDSVTFPGMLYDVSYGRTTDGNSSWSFFPVTTPNAANTGGGYTGIAGKADFSVDAGFYSSSQQVELSYPDSSAEIYYSLNGNEPSPSKGILYTGPITVDSMHVIRARVFVPGLIPGEVRTKSYFINRVHDLPIISIATDSLNLWDINTGIYVFGPPGSYSTSFPYMGSNFWEDWKCPGHVEMFEANDAQVISQNINLSISGNYSRAYAQKSFNLEAKDALGLKSIPYQIFPDLPVAEYKAFKLRNGGQDWSYTTIRDGMNHKLIEGFMANDHQDNRPAAVYLNGEYWGILNITEKIDKDYINEHHPEVDKDSIDLLENNATELEGSNDDYNDLISYVTYNSMTNQNNYNYVKTQMDVENFMDLNQLRIYLAATDWPSNNQKFWRPSDGSRKWEWIVWDTERSTMIKWDRETNYDHNTLNWATDHTLFGWGYPTWSTLLLRRLLMNNEFKTEFIRKFATHINITFCQQRMDSVTEFFRNRITSEMPNHIAKWKDSNDTMVYWTQGYFKNMTEWNLKVDTIKIFFARRAPYMRTFIMDQFGITDTSILTINKVPVDGGIVYVDSFEVPDNHCDLVYFNGYDVQLTAIANPGYTFAGWTTAGGDTLPITWNPNGDTTVTAYFTAPAPEPTVASTTILSAISNCTEANLSWINGDGSSRIVVMKAGSPVNALPADGVEYTGNAAFGSGDDLGGGNYVLYAGSGNSCSVTNLTLGIQYHIAILEYNGSTVTANYNTTNFAVSDFTAQSFTMTLAVSDNEMCEGDSVTLSAGGGISYTWSPANGLSSTTDSSVTATPSSDITYSVEVTGADGCLLSDSIAIQVHPLPVVNLGNDSTICVYNNIMLDAGAGNTSYLWSTGATTQSILVDSSGTGIGTTMLNVVITNAFNCASSDDIAITFDICAGTSFNQTMSLLNIYPNPFTDEFFVECEDLGINIELYDIIGNSLLKKTMEVHRLSIHENIPPGIYFLRLVNKTESYTIKLLKTD